jgi:hypothetical protein
MNKWKWRSKYVLKIVITTNLHCKMLKNDMYTTIYSRANNFSKKSTHSKNNSFPPSQTPKP